MEVQNISEQNILYNINFGSVILDGFCTKRVDLISQGYKGIGEGFFAYCLRWDHFEWLLYYAVSIVFLCRHTVIFVVT